MSVIKPFAHHSFIINAAQSIDNHIFAIILMKLTTFNKLLSMELFTHGSLFSGIGCAEIAAVKQGIQNVFTLEKNDYCNKVLQRHHPSAIHFATDIKTVVSIPKVDILTFGFPCQNASNANGTTVLDPLQMNKTGLFWDAVRLIETSKPRVIVAENVLPLLQKSGFTVVETLANLGYTIGWTVLTAAQFSDNLHKRSRVFFIGIEGATVVEMARILKMIHRYPLRYACPNLDNLRSDTTQWNKSRWAIESERITACGNAIFIPCLDAIFDALATVEIKPKTSYLQPSFDLFNELQRPKNIPITGVYNGSYHKVQIPSKPLGRMQYSTPVASDGFRLLNFSVKATLNQLEKRSDVQEGITHFWAKTYGTKPNPEIFEVLMGLPIDYTNV